MFVYLAGVDVEVQLPNAVEARVLDETVEFLDASGATVALFPAASVVMYSKERSYRGAPLSNDGEWAESSTSDHPN